LFHIKDEDEDEKIDATYLGEILSSLLEASGGFEEVDSRGARGGEVVQLLTDEGCGAFGSVELD